MACVRACMFDNRKHCKKLTLKGYCIFNGTDCNKPYKIHLSLLSGLMHNTVDGCDSGCE